MERIKDAFLEDYDESLRDYVKVSVFVFTIS